MSMGGRPTILIADDNGDLRDALSVVFTSAGLRVVTAADGVAALLTAERERPDVVLTDVTMPGLDGVALCAALRERPGLRDVPIAVLSGTLEHDDPRARAGGPCVVLREPTPNAKLVATVRRLLSEGHPAGCHGHRPT